MTTIRLTYRIFLTSLICFTALSLTPLQAQAQALRSEVDRENGEAQRIQQRNEWFYKNRIAAAGSARNAADLRAAEAELLGAQSRIPMRTPYASLSARPWESLGPTPMTMLNWQMGNVAGRAAALAIDPRTDDMLYFGTASGGLWRSFNGGNSWSEVLGSYGTQSVGALAIDPNNPDRVWVGTGEKGTNCASYFGIGVLVSENRGSSFTLRNGPSGVGALQLSFINAMAVQPGNSDVVMVGGFGFCNPDGSTANGALYRSTDRGLTWTPVLTGRTNDVLFDPAQPSIVYAAVGDRGYFKSVDGGATFNAINTGITLSARMRIALSPSNTQRLYGYSSAGAAVRSDDAGASWTSIGSGTCEGQCTYNLAISADPFDANRALFGSIRHRFVTGGDTVQAPMTTSWGSAQLVHQDTQLVHYSNRIPGRFWVGTDGGLWRSDDGGASYANLNGGLNITQFYDVAIDPRDPRKLWGGAQDNSSLVRNGSNLWNVTMVTGDGFMNLVDPDQPQVVFQTSYASNNFPVLRRSTTGGLVGFASVPTTGLIAGPFQFLTQLAIVAGNGPTPSQAFVASDRLFRADSAANSISWTDVSPRNSLGAATPFSGVLSTIHPVWGNGVPSTLGVWVGVGGGLQFSANVLAAAPSYVSYSGFAGTRSISDIAVDTNNQNRMFVTRVAFLEPRLYRSLDGGVSFSAVGAGLPQVPANAVAIDPINAEQIYVGTDVGVYASSDGGLNFAREDRGMPVGAVITDLEINRNPRALVAASYGRGAWVLDLDDSVLLVDGFE